MGISGDRGGIGISGDRGGIGISRDRVGTGTPHARQRVPWRAACVVGLTAAAVSGCGSSGSGSPSTASTAPSASAGATAPAGTTAVGTGATGAPVGVTGGTGATGGSAVATKAQFIAMADKVCRAASSQLKTRQTAVNAAAKLEAKHDTAAHRAALAAAVREETALARPQLDQLRALTPPAADRSVVAKYIAAVASNADLIDQFAAAIDANSGRGVSVASAKLAEGKATADGLAQGYGFKVCGNPKF
jgi:hypothetical protein